MCRTHAFLLSSSNLRYSMDPLHGSLLYLMWCHYSPLSHRPSIDSSLTQTMNKWHPQQALKSVHEEVMELVECCLSATFLGFWETLLPITPSLTNLQLPGQYTVGLKLSASQCWARMNRQDASDKPWPAMAIPRETLSQHHSVPMNFRTADTEDPQVILPYVQCVSEAKRQILAPLSVNVSFQPNMAFRHLLVRPKDHVQESEMAGVVYQIHCAVCPATYMGETGRRGKFLFSSLTCSSCNPY